MKLIPGATILLVLACALLAAGCTSPQSHTAYAAIRTVDLSIPSGQPPSNITEVVVRPYLEARYSDVENAELQVIATEYNTDIVVTETVVPIGTLSPGKTKTESISLLLENGRKYDLRVTVWQDGRMQESGSVDVYLPDRTVAAQKLAYSSLSINAVDVMSPDIEADPITLDIITTLSSHGPEPSGDLTMDIRVVNLQTGLTAIRESRDLGRIGATTESEKTVSVAVPNGYDYSIHLRLFEDGVLFGTSTGRVTLAPEPEVIIAGQSGLTLHSALSSTDGSSGRFPTPVPTPAPATEAQVGQFRIETSGVQAPTPASSGFGGMLGIAGLAGGMLVLSARRRRG